MKVNRIWRFVVIVLQWFTSFFHVHVMHQSISQFQLRPATPCLKWHYSTVQSLKNVAVVTKGGAFALFFCPHPGGFESSRVPTPGNLPSKAKKMLMPGVSPQLELTDQCITTKCTTWLYSVVLCQKDQCYLHTVIPHIYIHCIVIWNLMVTLIFFKQVFALKSLHHIVDVFWAEISESVGKM